MSSIPSKIIIPPGKVRERLDLYLTHHVENVTRSKVQDAIKNGFVTVNSKKVKSGYKVSPGDVIDIIIPRTPAPDVVPEDIRLEIVYEDDNLIIINKPAGMVTHPAYGNYSGTLVNALLFHCKSNLSSLNGSGGRPGIVHRLDKETSGLMVIAKDDFTHANLSKQFASRTIDREYWSIVWGLFDKGKKSGMVEASLGRSKSDRKKFAVNETGKIAITEYHVLEQYKYLSLVRLKLKTGRTHQIRVHLHHIGHPVFGDPTYGGRRIAWGGTEKNKKEEVQEFLKIIRRQALHAKTIGFVHPVTKSVMKFDSELPEDFSTVLNSLRKSL